MGGHGKQISWLDPSASPQFAPVSLSLRFCVYLSICLSRCLSISLSRSFVLVCVFGTYVSFVTFAFTVSKSWFVCYLGDPIVLYSGDDDDDDATATGLIAQRWLDIVVVGKLRKHASNLSVSSISRTFFFVVEFSPNRIRALVCGGQSVVVVVVVEYLAVYCARSPSVLHYDAVRLSGRLRVSSLWRRVDQRFIGQSI